VYLQLVDEDVEAEHEPSGVVVVRKEFREFRRHRFVIGTMIALPVVFLIIQSATASIKAGTSAAAIKAVWAGHAHVLPGAADPAHVISAYRSSGAGPGNARAFLTTPSWSELLLARPWPPCPHGGHRYGCSPPSVASGCRHPSGGRPGVRYRNPAVILFARCCSLLGLVAWPCPAVHRRPVASSSRTVRACR